MQYTLHMPNTPRARHLRRDSTLAERSLWRHVRHRALDGHKFRRQAPVGPYFVDFVCLEQRLIVELDGGQHDERSDDDRRRTEWLESEGYRVLRFWNADVLRNMEGVLDSLRAELGKT